MILDQFGNPIDLTALREPQTARIAPLQREWAEHPAKGLTPAKLASLLVAAEQGNLMAQLDLADDMLERDGHVFAELDKRAAAVLPVPFTIREPRNANAKEKAATAAVAEWMTQLPDFAGVLKGMMDAVLKGFACHEMTWAMQERVYLPAQLVFRPQRWFCLDELGTQIQLRDGSAWGQPLKPFVWLRHTHRSLNGYLARNALVRVLAWPYLFKWFSTQSLAEFLEIYGLPLRLGKYPAGATPNEKSRLLAAVVNLGRNAAGIIPQGMQIDFENAAEGTHVPFEAMLQRMDAIQSKVIVGQTLSSGEGQHGTQALGQVHNEVRMDIRDADLQQLAATLTQQLIWPMVAANLPGIAHNRTPRFEFITDEAADMKAFADNQPKLVAVGMNRIGLDWVHDRLKIPMAKEGEAVLTAPAPAPGPTPQPAPAPVAVARAKSQAPAAAAPAHPPDLLDGVLDDALDDWRPLLAPMVQPLLDELDRAIAAGESAQAFRDRVPALLGLMDPEALGSGLADAAFKAHLVGAADLDLAGNEGEA